MKIFPKIIYIWLGIVAFFYTGLFFFEHKEIQFSGLINLLSLSLLMIICYFLYEKTPGKSTKFIFLNFLIFFSFSILAFLHLFIGKSFFTDYKFADHYYFQYYTAFYIFALALSVVYLVIDVVLANFRVSQKYFVALSICVLFFGFYFTPILSDPHYLYKTEEIQQWKTLANYVDKVGNYYTSEELSNQVNLKSWNYDKPIGDLYPSENLAKIEELLPYLEGENYRTLLIYPLYSNIINIEIMIIGFIILFFGYQYKKEPPQGAYMDKIVFALLLFTSTDILHYWGYMKSVEWNSLTEFFTVGQYISNIILLLLVILFALRLKFVVSPQGAFYESELSSNPSGISRWRDSVDDFIMKKFFVNKPVQGRLFEQSVNKNHTN
ncbi:MAG: hypothetical protein HY960_00885 [Ignavibacteriae bacterium]|nr:hypothetical protein [Ignavibacteriota bacterium]